MLFADESVYKALSVTVCGMGVNHCTFELWHFSCSSLFDRCYCLFAVAEDCQNVGFGDVLEVERSSSLYCTTYLKSSFKEKLVLWWHLERLNNNKEVWWQTQGVGIQFYLSPCSGIALWFCMHLFIVTYWKNSSQCDSDITQPCYEEWFMGTQWDDSQSWQLLIRPLQQRACDRHCWTRGIKSAKLPCQLCASANGCIILYWIRRTSQFLFIFIDSTVHSVE